MENNTNQSHQLLHSYCLNPEVKLDTQGLNEPILVVVRSHPFTQLPWIFNSVFLFILLITLNILLFSIFSTAQVIFINTFSIILILSYIWFNILDWFFNVGIVTNERIIDVDFMNVLYKEVTEARLDKVEDITSKSGGFFESFFDYGDVFIQTAGSAVHIEFMNISKPSDVVRIISDLV